MESSETPLNPFNEPNFIQERVRRRLPTTTNPFRSDEELRLGNSNSTQTTSDLRYEYSSMDNVNMLNLPQSTPLNPFIHPNPFENLAAFDSGDENPHSRNPFDRRNADMPTHTEAAKPDMMSTRGGKKRYAKPIKFPADFDGSQNLRGYLRHFQHCCLLNGWNDEEAAVFLAASLHGEAQKVLNGLSEADCCDYKKIVGRLELRFGVEKQRELHQARLHNRRQNDGESAQALASDIRSMANLAYQDLQPDVQERFAVQHFINAIKNPDDRLRIRRDKPQNIDEALSLACELEEFRLLDHHHLPDVHKLRAVDGPEKDVALIGSELKKLHEQILQQQEQLEKQNKTLQHFIEQTQHLSKPPPRPVGETPQQRPYAPRNYRNNVQCWNCKEFGHFRNQCPHQRQNDVKPGNERRAPPKAQGDA